MYKLVIQDDEGKTTIVPLIRDEITIGRKEGNTIRLTERNVSRQHARIVRGEGTIQIEDLGSYNGVRVNGAKIAQRTALSVSDRAQIGDYLIEIKAESNDTVVTAAIDDSKTVPALRAIGAAGATQVTTVPSGVAALSDRQAATAVTAAIPIEEMPADETTQVSVARVVALSSNFAGQEWRLAGAQTVIGRTDENDIVINHRSISRNHAKISREAETGKYTISDLQSSNGVRVNGEEYGKVELRRGDIVDLGHVRLRFIEPGEDFVFGRDAQIADVPTGSGNRPLLIGALAVLLIGGSFMAYKLMSGKDSAAKGGAGSGNVAMLIADARPGNPIDAKAVAMILADARAPEITPLGETELATKLTECRAVIDKENWTELQNCAQEALALDPTNTVSTTYLGQAKRELSNSLQYEKMLQAVKQSDNSALVSAYEKIDVDSVYRERARQAHDSAHDAYERTQVASAKKLAARNKCSDINSLASSSGKVWADVSDAVKAVPCKVEVASGATDPVKPPKDCDYQALISQARTAFGSANYAPAIKAAEAALACDAKSADARKIGLLSACRSKNAAKINKFYRPGLVAMSSMYSDCGDLLPANAK